MNYLGPGTLRSPKSLGKYSPADYFAQRKYDGWFCRVEIQEYKIVGLFTRTGLALPIDFACAFIGLTSPVKRATLFAEAMLGSNEAKRYATPTMFVFDGEFTGTHNMRAIEAEALARGIAMLSKKQHALAGQVRIAECFDADFALAYADVIRDCGEGIVLKPWCAIPAPGPDGKDPACIKIKSEHRERMDNARPRPDLAA